MNNTGTAPTIKMVNVEKIHLNPWNPNRMPPEARKILRDNLKRIGFVQPILVRPSRDPITNERTYQVVDGEHRFTEAKAAGLTEIPVVIVKMSKTEAKKQTVRMNKLRGKLDTRQFNHMVNEMIEAGVVDESNAAFEFGYSDPSEFTAIRQSVRMSLPTPAAQREFDKRVFAAKSADDIYALMLELFRKHGDSLPSHYMFINITDSKNMWIKLDHDLYDEFSEMATTCRKLNVTFSSFIVAAMKAVGNARVFINGHRDMLTHTDRPVPSEQDLFA